MFIFYTFIRGISLFFRLKGKSLRSDFYNIVDVFHTLLLWCSFESLAIRTEHLIYCISLVFCYFSLSCLRKCLDMVVNAYFCLIPCIRPLTYMALFMFLCLYIMFAIKYFLSYFFTRISQENIL